MGLWTVHIYTVHYGKSTFAVTVHIQCMNSSRLWGKTRATKKKKKKEKTQEIKLNKTQRVSKHWHNLHWNLLLEFVLGGDYARGVEEKFSEPSNYSWWAGQHGLEVLWNKTKQKQIGYQSIMSYFFNLSFTATIAFFFFLRNPLPHFNQWIIEICTK